MEVTALSLVHSITSESFRWFLETRAVVDQFIIFIDDNRANGETRSRARQIATEVFSLPCKGYIEPHLREMVSVCSTEWILRIDSDEQLSPEWHDGSWRKLLRPSDVTHCWLPRRWITSPGRFVCVSPWWPDPQLRLFRRDAPSIEFPAALHEPMKVGGSQGLSTNLAIHHHILPLSSRQEREEKVRRYEKIRPGGALGSYYLFEDYRPLEASLPPVTRALGGPETWTAKSEQILVNNP